MTEPSDFTQHEWKCKCGAELLFYCRAGTGGSIGRRVGVCPDCGEEHDVPDTVLRVFRKVNREWVSA